MLTILVSTIGKYASLVVSALTYRSSTERTNIAIPLSLALLFVSIRGTDINPFIYHIPQVNSVTCGQSLALLTSVDMMFAQLGVMNTRRTTLWVS